MRNILLLSASIILIGAGCSSAAPVPEKSTGTQNEPVTQQQVLPTTEQQPAAAATPAVTQPKPQPAQTVTQPAPQPVVEQTPTTPSFTMSQVSANNTLSKCWTVVNGNVYDLTSYAPKHPGGKEQIAKICGKDGSAAFNDQHGGDEKPESMLSRLKIGILK